MANHLSESVPERTFQYQNSLPPLPVPSLEISLSKYLDAGRTSALFCIVIHWFKVKNGLKKTVWHFNTVLLVNNEIISLAKDIHSAELLMVSLVLHQSVLLRLRKSLRPQRSSWRTSNRVWGKSCTSGSCRELKPGGTGCVFHLST